MLKQDHRGSLVMGLVVASHRLLDALVHVHNLQLYPGRDGPIDFCLWSSRAAALVVELAIFCIGLVMYLRTTQADDRYGSRGLWLLVLFLFISYAANLFDPPPPSIKRSHGQTCLSGSW